MNPTIDVHAGSWNNMRLFVLHHNQEIGSNFGADAVRVMLSRARCSAASPTSLFPWTIVKNRSFIVHQSRNDTVVQSAL